MCANEALKYGCKSEFQKKSHKAYDAAYSHDWLNDICLHMTPKYLCWNKEMCHEIALKYKTRKEFQLSDNKAYDATKTHGWLNDVCSHMIKTGNRFFRCIYVYEFSDNYAYVGLSHNIHTRNINRKASNADQVTKHIKLTQLQPTIKQLTDFVDVNEAIVLEIEFIEKYRNNNWNMLNKARGGAIGGGIIKWTKENCTKEALKYNTKIEFYNGCCGARKAAIRYGWYDEICKHMIKPTNQNIKWNKENCIKEALKFKKKCDFKYGCGSAYNASRRYGWLNEITLHMK